MILGKLSKLPLLIPWSGLAGVHASFAVIVPVAEPVVVCSHAGWLGFVGPVGPQRKTTIPAATPGCPKWMCENNGGPVKPVPVSVKVMDCLSALTFATKLPWPA